MLFTILTPSYNRAYTLPRLYESLLSQDFADFEWLVVDDGSADGTRDLIDRYKAEAKIRIRYRHQDNAGKHTAINAGLLHARGEFFWILDSDDYLRGQALTTAANLAARLPEDFGGFTVIRFTDDIDFNPDDFGKREWTEGAYTWPHHGEMTFVWKTAIARKYPFPVFEGEKFCQESLVLRRILGRFGVIYTDHVLIGGEYLEDGLSQNMWQRMQQSPRYSLLNYAERISQKAYSTEAERMQLARNYWDIALSARHIPWREKLRGLPVGLTARVFYEKLRRKSGL